MSGQLLNFRIVELPRVNDALALLNVGALNFFLWEVSVSIVLLKNGKYILPKR